MPWMMCPGSKLLATARLFTLSRRAPAEAVADSPPPRPPPCRPSPAPADDAADAAADAAAADRADSGGTLPPPLIASAPATAAAVAVAAAAAASVPQSRGRLRRRFGEALASDGKGDKAEPPKRRRSRPPSQEPELARGPFSEPESEGSSSSQSESAPLHALFLASTRR